MGVRRPRRPTVPGDRGAACPATATGSYDVRDVVTGIVDEGSLLELRERWAPNVVTALATIGGRPIGVVANQPLALAGTLDIAASQKAARFVAFCDAFNLAILTLVDTPGFYPGKDLEWRGMIRHGAQLVFAYARATVPRVCVILRKSYGGAYIVMDSKRMGNDVCLAWPSAELAVMGAGQAAAILHRRATPERARRVRGRLRAIDCSTPTSPPSAATSTPSSTPPRPVPPSPPPSTAFTTSVRCCQRASTATNRV